MTLTTHDLYTEADLYCAAFSWPIDGEVEWLLRTCGELIGRSVRSVLEPFCGNARYGPAFVQRGVDYWGLDLSQSMLDRAPRLPGITLVHGDARTLHIPDAPQHGFDLAWCPVNSIRHLIDERDIAAHLQAIRSHLARSGVYAFEIDLSTYDGFDQGESPRRSTWSMPQPDGSIVHAVWHREQCDLAQRICQERGTFSLERDGHTLRQINHLYTMRQWTFSDLLQFARRGGFEIVGAFRSQASAGWPAVELAPALENSEYNHVLFLRAAD